MKKQLGGYAKELPYGMVRIAGFYGREAYIPIDELDTLVAEFNEEVWNTNSQTEDITLRQITGSGGPSDDFVLFCVNKHDRYKYGNSTVA